jgi:hypothetical protein
MVSISPVTNLTSKITPSRPFRERGGNFSQRS